MARLIDGDALLEKMKHRREYVGRPSDPVCLVEDAPTVGGWVSVKDRLPKIDDGHYFLVVKSDGFMEVAFFQHKGKRSHWGKGNCKITHWMPLPEPPKEDN